MHGILLSKPGCMAELAGWLAPHRWLLVGVVLPRHPPAHLPTCPPAHLPTPDRRACRDALAAARMLNRTLVLPTSWCYCDYDWTPHVLEKCKIRGSDLRLPFECPADFVFHIPQMELQQQPVHFRMPGFLEDPRVR